MHLIRQNVYLGLLPMKKITALPIIPLIALMLILAPLASTRWTYWHSTITLILLLGVGLIALALTRLL